MCTLQEDKAKERNSQKRGTEAKEGHRRRSRRQRSLLA
jgi:hypothetical protein